jgi:ATP-dependent DNA ligase
MAIQTSKTIVELKAKCDALGLSATPTKSTKMADDSVIKTWCKEDYIKALREYYIKQLTKEQAATMRLILQIESPMLCQQSKVLTALEYGNLWIDNNEWRAEEKEDGNRMLIVWHNGYFDAFSRNISDVTFLPISYKEHILTEGCDLAKVGHDFIVDCEVVSSDPAIVHNKVQTKTQLQAVTAILCMNSDEGLELQRAHPLVFKAFDVIYYDGAWLVKKPLKDRLSVFDNLLPLLKTTGLHIERPPFAMTDKRKFFEGIIAANGEGVVMKNLNAEYNTTGNRQRDGWVKVKRSASLTMKSKGLADSVDAYVTGYKLGDEDKALAGYVGTLVFSVKIKMDDGTIKEREIANIASFTLDERKKMTAYDSDGKPILDNSYYGKVASIDGQNFSARKENLQHPRFLCWRPDRSEDTCVMDEAFIKSQIM